MPEAPLPPSAQALHAQALHAPAPGTPLPGDRPAWLDAATFALMRQAARDAREDATALAREVVAARYPALPAALLTEAALIAASAAGRDLPPGGGA